MLEKTHITLFFCYFNVTQRMLVISTWGSRILLCFNGVKAFFVCQTKMKVIYKENIMMLHEYVLDKIPKKVQDKVNEYENFCAL